jgi:HSP20 family protein
MAITKWEPFALRPFFRAHRWPRWFEDWDWSEQKGLKIRETKENIVAEAVVAGVPAKEVEVNIEDGVLTIKAEREEEKKEKKVSRYQAYQYYYTAALSGGQWDKAKAEIEDGVVTVTIPKAKAARPQKVKVTAKAKA